MADTFDCPKCGAPVKYNSAEQGYLETITCPYCGESIVIPAEMHPQPPAPQPVFQPSRAYQPYASSEEDRKFLEEMDREDQEFNAKMAKRDKRDKMVSTIGTIVGLTIGGGAVILFVIIPLIISLGFGVISLFNQPSSSSAGTSVAHIAPTHAPTPTSAAQGQLFSLQSQWPVVIQEGFTNNKLNWTTGTDNSDMALEQKSISGGKYTWELTSKRSIGSFEYPNMPIQKDLFVSLDMQMTSTSHTADDRAGIVFRHSEEKGSFYFFGVSSSDGSFTLSLYDGSGWNDLISPTQSTAIKSDQVNHLAISMAGSQILLQINNQIVGNSEDNKLASGDAGMGINLPGAGIDAKAIFTNFIVRAPQK